MNPIPVLETERLILRAHEIADLDAFAMLWSDPQVTRFTSGAPLSREDAWRRLAMHSGMWSLMGFGYFATIEKDTGAFLGSVGVQECRRAITPSIEGTMEAGWVLAPQAHGRGFAREAMTAALAWCARAHPSLSVSCIINVENDASLRLAARLGFRELARTMYKDEPTIVFRYG
ncbi:GNAT family N-acetyltransferase [Nitratireductor sp. ZSWI3]|uniref:GNAT family N-acetyltransferase n=1 Tax=Nitratireductor sp. ZSWI3 TaxID=2966359 RepID=UPI0021500D41|nr:GNAT family N-acetyltransferase [Nitratireductor sp. ZSWI3]MCR4266372.1 GNAT family N-acetyltransferase [Nitratireductor sp. ZSWI3]